MLVFINKVYMLREQIGKIELVIHDSKSRTNRFVILGFSEALSLCKELEKDKNNIVYCLNKQGQFVLSKNVRRIECSNDLPQDSDEIEINMTSVYDLYVYLSATASIYIDKEFKYPNGYIGPVSYFDSLNVSEDSMSVSIPVVYNDSVVANRELISQPNNVVQSSFTFAIPKSNKHGLAKFGVIEVGSMIINEQEYSVFEYNANLSIYTTAGVDKFPEPVVVHYGSSVYTIKILTRLVSKYLDSLNFNLSGVKSNVKSDLVQGTSLFNDNTGVFFHNEFEVITDDMIDEIYYSCNQAYLDLSSRFDYEDSKAMARKSKIIKKILGKYDFNPNIRTATSNFLSFLFRVKHADNNTLAVEQKFIYKSSLLIGQLYLFSIRMGSILISDELIELTGSAVSSIYGPYSEMRMEVWKL